MHSRIIEARDCKDNVRGIDEGTFEDISDVHSFSDYIRDIPEDESDDIADWLDLEGLRYDSNERTLTIESKEAYFEAKYESFQTAITELAKIDIKGFISGAPWMPLYALTAAFNNEFSIHLYGLDYYGGGLCTLDDFVRDHEEGTKVFIGNMVDYHF